VAIRADLGLVIGGDLADDETGVRPALLQRVGLWLAPGMDVPVEVSVMPDLVSDLDRLLAARAHAWEFGAEAGRLDDDLSPVLTLGAPRTSRQADANSALSALDNFVMRGGTRVGWSVF
jgi:hypothetical protein